MMYCFATWYVSPATVALPRKWVQQVKTLCTHKCDKLVEGYLVAFPRFYPQEKLTDLLQK